MSTATLDIKFEHPAIINDERSALALLDELVADGAAVVGGVPTDLDGLRSIAAVIGEIRATNYGIDWEIQANLDPLTPIDGDVPMRVHSDLPYRQAPPAVQLLLSVQADAGGGATLLVDGYAVADELKRRDPDGWKALTEVPWTYIYPAPTHYYVGGGPLIGLDRNGDYDVFRHAPGLNLPLETGGELGTRAEAARDRFMEIATEAEFETRIRLEPGQLLLFNNHRMLHGRTPLDLTVGGRHLLGCYCELDDVNAVRRRIRHNLAASNRNGS